MHNSHQQALFSPQKSAEDRQKDEHINELTRRYKVEKEKLENHKHSMTRDEHRTQLAVNQAFGAHIK